MSAILEKKKKKGKNHCAFTAGGLRLFGTHMDFFFLKIYFVSWIKDVKLNRSAQVPDFHVSVFLGFHVFLAVCFVFIVLI